MYRQRFTIIGIPDNKNHYFNEEILSVIKNGKIFSGGKRHRILMEDKLPEKYEWIDISVPLEETLKEYQAHDDIVVFASGDPLFYGYANTLKREFPDSEIKVFPYFNSLQMLAHTLMISYAEMVNVSLTGRLWKELDMALLENRELIGILTDRKKTPEEIARRLLAYGYDNYKIFVGEKLGNEKERIFTLDLAEASQREFVTPNCVILQQIHRRKRFFGIPEEEFHHLEGRKNMITKMPVRLLSLAMMNLYDKTTLWDIGFCTGSVSIEAKLQFPALDIVAFEKREESGILFEKNTKKFGVPGIKCVICDFLEASLEEYPSPDVVFIGGHGGKLEEMIDKVYDYMKPAGCIVFNSVMNSTCQQFEKAIEKHGRRIVDRHTLTLDTHNPITILKAI